LPINSLFLKLKTTIMRTTIINSSPWLVKKTSLKFYAFATILCFIAVSFLSTAGFAQSVAASKLNCPVPSGTSKDLSVVDVFVDLPPCTTCSGSTITAPLKMTIHNGTKSERTAFSLYGTLSSGASINGISGTIVVCVGPITVKSDQDIGYGVGNQTFTVGNITFSCTLDLSLANNVLAWTDASGTTADRCVDFLAATRCRDVQPKCDTASSINIRQPLAASDTTTEGCTGRSAGKIKVIPVGGTAKYTIVLKKGTATVATQNNVTASGYEFTGLVEGTDYSAVITDATTPPAAHCTYTLTPITLGSFFCCTAPTVATNPADTASCPGGGVTFTATPSGGDPTPTTKWQIKSTAAGASFTDLTIAGVYSLTNSNHTLNLSSVTGLNGFQFRAVFTSGDCAPATTSAATLTVYSVPPQPHGVPQSITDPCNVSTFCVIIDNVVADATYTIKDKNGVAFGNTVTITHQQSPGTAIGGTSAHSASTNNITFCGIPAGAGFTLTVVSDHNCAPTGSSTPCGTPDPPPTPGQTQRVIVSNEVNTIAPPTVKAYPNPFNDRVKFVVNSSVAGNGSLEVYDMLGQKIKTIYQGHINKGDQAFELSMPVKQQTPIIYIFRVGGKQVTGKLLQLNK
jgi:hypothetical protein